MTPMVGNILSSDEDGLTPISVANAPTGDGTIGDTGPGGSPSHLCINLADGSCQLGWEISRRLSSADCRI